MFSPSFGRDATWNLRDSHFLATAKLVDSHLAHRCDRYCCTACGGQYTLSGCTQIGSPDLIDMRRRAPPGSPPPRIVMWAHNRWAHPPQPPRCAATKVQQSLPTWHPCPGHALTTFISPNLLVLPTRLYLPACTAATWATRAPPTCPGAATSTTWGSWPARRGAERRATRWASPPSRVRECPGLRPACPPIPYHAPMDR